MNHSKYHNFYTWMLSPIHSLQQGLIISPSSTPPHHFSPSNSANIEHCPNTILCLAQGVDIIPLLPPLILRMWMWTLSHYDPLSYYPPSAVFSLSAFLSPIHSYTFSCIPANEARHSRVKQMIMSANTKFTFWRLLTIFSDPILRLILSLVCSKLRF